VVVAERVGERVHADVELLAVAAEGESGEEGLRGMLFRAGVREVGNGAGLCVEHGQRLHGSGGDRSVARVDGDDVAMVGADGHVHGKVVDALRASRDGLEELLAVGKVDGLSVRRDGRGNGGESKESKRPAGDSHANNCINRNAVRT
jgi:hypothetical protein